MKKVVLLGMMVLLLSGCSKKSNSQNASGNGHTSSNSSSSKISQTESDKKTTSDNSIYDVVLAKLKNDTSEYPATHYAYYDIDGNGQDELFSGRCWDSTGTVNFAALYYDNNGVADYLAQSYVASAGGYREGVTIYKDGTVISAKWTSLGTEMEDTQYQLRTDNTGVDIIKSASVPIGGNTELSDYFDVKDKEEFDFSVLNWQKLTTAELTHLKDLDATQIRNGDYSTLAGTWVNGRGQTLTFNSDGTMGENGDGIITGIIKSQNGIVMLSCGNKTAPVGGFAVVAIPIGVTYPLKDNSDQSKPRLLAGQQLSFAAEDYYYRQ